jgi:hypothetical protein
LENLTSAHYDAVVGVSDGPCKTATAYALEKRNRLGSTRQSLERDHQRSGFLHWPLDFIPLPHALNESLSDNGERMFGIAIFWFVIGLSIDRRISKRALDLQHPTRAGLLFAFTALICGVFAYGGITYVFCPSPNMTCWEQGSKMFGTVVSVVAKYPLRTSDSMALSVSGWLLVLGAYFVKRAFTALRRSKLRIKT